jgi:hypothetical protein
MSFWSAQPTTAKEGGFYQNLSDQDALDKINKELEAAKIKLDYTVLEGADTTPEKRKEILTFINQNYLNTEYSRVEYSSSILDYYLRDSLALIFHPKGRHDTMVGLIILRRKNLQIYNTVSSISEASFLCLVPKLRSLHLAPYIIGICVREGILKQNTSKAYYTIADPIKSPSFGRKYVYYRPVNIDIAIKSNILPSNVNKKMLKIQYNNFTDISALKYISGKEDQELVSTLQEKILDYSKKTYNIFDHKPKQDIEAILRCPAFHIFLFYNEADITNIICMNEVEIFSPGGDSYKMGYIYINIFSDYSTKHIRRIIDSVAAYCLKHKVVDNIAVLDNFPIDNYTDVNFFKVESSLAYYIYNMNTAPVDNKKNGIIMI